MKLKCIKNNIAEGSYYMDLYNYLTIGKIYFLSGKEPCSQYVYNIIDNFGNPHDMSKDLFIDFTKEFRDIRLKELGI